jgi:hypothetical protein
MSSFECCGERFRAEFIRCLKNLREQETAVMDGMKGVREQFWDEFPESFTLQPRFRDDGRGGIRGFQWSIPMKDGKNFLWLPLDHGLIYRNAIRYYHERAKFWYYDYEAKRLWPLWLQYRRGLRGIYRSVARYSADIEVDPELLYAPYEPEDEFTLAGIIGFGRLVSQWETRLSQLVSDLDKELTGATDWRPIVEHPQPGLLPLVVWIVRPECQGSYSDRWLPTRLDGKMTERAMRKLGLDKRSRAVIHPMNRRLSPLLSERKKLAKRIAGMRDYYDAAIHATTLPYRPKSSFKLPPDPQEKVKATNAQIKRLQEWSIVVPPNCTSAEARNLMRKKKNQLDKEAKERRERERGQNPPANPPLPPTGTL